MSKREALCRVTGQDGDVWNSPYSLEWYQNEIVKYGLNKVRHDICRDTELVVAHADWALEHDIVVEYTLGDGDRELGNREEVITRLAGHPNVIFEVWNEMYSKKDVDEAVWWAKYCHDEGVICSGGAIGAGGEKWAYEFFRLNPPVNIIQVHRHWLYPNDEENDWILKYIDEGKPMDRNEYFDMGKLGLRKTKFVMKKSFEHGAQLFDYYSFRMADLDGIGTPDSEPYYKYLEFASEICQQLNQ